MLHILLLILKIIGIILLVILGVVLVLICNVLFVPVRYQITAKTDDGIDNLCIVAKATWILHLVSAYFSYKDKKSDWKVRIFWKRYTAGDGEEVKKSKNSAKSSKEKRQETAGQAADDGEKTSDERINEKKPTWIAKIKCTIQKKYDKIKKIWKTKETISSFLRDENHQAAFQTILREIRYIARHARPRKAKGFVRFGFEDPYRTGQMLAVLSVLYPFYGERIAIYPEFEHAVLQGDISTKGYIRLLHFIKIIWTFLFDENVRKTYEDYKGIKH